MSSTRFATLATLAVALSASPLLPAQATESAAPESGARERAAHAHDHAQAGSTALVKRLELAEGGVRWPTDEALREGMAAVRAAFDADHPAIHAGRQTDAQYAALAARIEAAVNGIVAQCKLPPDADAQLHHVVGDLLQGAGWMRGNDPGRSRHDGASRVHGALRAYGKFFDDPSWPADAGGHHGHH